MKPLSISTGHRTRGVAVALAGALLLAACGGGGGGDDAFMGKQDGAGPAGGESPVGDDPVTGEPFEDTGGDGEQPLASGEATSYLPIDAAAPSGSRTVAESCGPDDDDVDVADGEDPWPKHRSPVLFAVPDGWRNIETSSNGSGYLVGNDVRMRFSTESKDKVEVGFKWDQRNLADEITDPNGDPRTTFDYDSTRGDSSTVIEYDKVATVSIGDQDVDLFYRDPSQAPDHVSGEEYQARVTVMDVTNPEPSSSGTATSSFVLKITFDSDATDMNPDLVESIISSFSLPTCQWDKELLNQEFDRQIDLNGDGVVESYEERQAEQAKRMDEMMAEQEAELEAERNGG